MELVQVVENLITQILMKYSVQKFDLDAIFTLHFLNNSYSPEGQRTSSKCLFFDIFVAVFKFFASCLKKISTLLKLVLLMLADCYGFYLLLLKAPELVS